MKHNLLNRWILKKKLIFLELINLISRKRSGKLESNVEMFHSQVLSNINNNLLKIWRFSFFNMKKRSQIHEFWILTGVTNVLDGIHCHDYKINIKINEGDRRGQRLKLSKIYSLLTLQSQTISVRAHIKINTLHKPKLTCNTMKSVASREFWVKQLSTLLPTSLC